MRVSAIITGYNYARFLPAAIESVLAQTRPPDEIVVVDDGSTDNTREVVERYTSRGVRYVFKPNGGAGSARNRGIIETSGDLIAFLDGDDRWLPGKLEAQIAHLEQHPQAGLVSGGEWQVYESGAAPYLLLRPKVGAARLYPQILVENTIGNPSLTLVRRECFEQVGVFNEAMPLGQDWDMWIRIARRFAVGIVAEPLILFTRHDSSLTAGKLMERYRSNRLLHKRYIGEVRNPIARARILARAQSMNLYYTAAALADSHAQGQISARGKAFAMALLSALLAPGYDTRSKAGLLLRLVAGRGALKRLKRLKRLSPAGPAAGGRLC